MASSAMMKCAQFFDRMAMRAPRGKPRRHAPRLVERLRPGVVGDAALAQRLGQEQAVARLRFVVVHVVEDQLAHVGNLLQGGRNGDGG
ncbi:MAG: hypothetical protein MUF16_28695 [Burkholderiaceae bacterium]|nr:hypothetical protein [Burkholderiaceae bacterium]